jgi:tripartite-type tricarboxylate transporter receptor subunit TctC
LLQFSRRAILSAPLLAVPFLAAPAIVRAQTPVLNRTARILAGFPAGGTVDFTARLLAERLRGVWAPQVVVENRAGAAGRLAIEEALRAESDGSTILLSPASMITIYPHLYGDRLRYSPLRDLAPVSPVVVYPFAMAVGPAAPGVGNLTEFLALARQRGGLNYASPAAGSVPHFTGMMLARAAGVELNHVPYRGAAPAITDLLGGQVAASINVIGDVVPHLEGGRLRVVAITSAQRLPRFPNFPTFAEQGFPAMTADEWFGIFLPVRTPAPVAGALNEALRAVHANAGFRAALEQREFTPAHEDTGRFTARIQAETEKWGPVVEASGFRPEG